MILLAAGASFVAGFASVSRDRASTAVAGFVDRRSGDLQERHVASTGQDDVVTLLRETHTKPDYVWDNHRLRIA